MEGYLSDTFLNLSEENLWILLKHQINNINLSLNELTAKS